MGSRKHIPYSDVSNSFAAPMSNTFDLSFEHKGTEYCLKTVFVRLGYVHQFHVNYENTVLIFEFDENRDYRVINPNPAMQSIDQNLLSAMVEKISSLHETTD